MVQLEHLGLDKAVKFAVLYSFLKLLKIYIKSKSKRFYEPNDFQVEYFSSKVDNLWIYNRSWKSTSKNGIETKPKGVIFILHGFGDHCSRYNHVAEYLSLSGFDVYAHDHRGHGQSDSPNNFGVGYIGKFDDVVSDTIQFIDTTIEKLYQEDYPPIFILGHSFGGLIASYVAQHYKNRIAGVVISSPLFKGTKEMELFRNNIILRNFLKFLSKVTPFLRLGYINTTTLCTNKVIHEQFKYDKLSLRGAVPVRSTNEMIDASNQIINCLHNNVFSNQLLPPLLVLHSEADELTSFNQSKVVFDLWNTLYKQFIILKEEQHEILNEKTWVETMNKILIWINSRVPKLKHKDKLDVHERKSTIGSTIEKHSDLANRFKSHFTTESNIDDFLQGSPSLGG